MGSNGVWCGICAKYLAFGTYPTSAMGALVVCFLWNELLKIDFLAFKCFIPNALKLSISILFSPLLKCSNLQNVTVFEYLDIFLLHEHELLYIRIVAKDHEHTTLTFFLSLSYTENFL